MTLKKALKHFERLLSQTSKKSEIKVYQEFIQIITRLEERDLSATEIQTIEAKLDELDLESTATSNRRHYRKALRQFKKYLKNTYSLTTKNYYTHLGIGLGSSFGILFGIVILSGFERSLGISLGLALGMLTGLIIGRTIDAQAKAAGNTLY